MGCWTGHPQRFKLSRPNLAVEAARLVQLSTPRSLKALKLDAEGIKNMKLEASWILCSYDMKLLGFSRLDSATTKLLLCPTLLVDPPTGVARDSAPESEAQRR